MPLRITGPGDEKIVDVSGTSMPPAPVGYLDAEGRFHKERPTDTGDCVALYDQKTYEALVERLQSATNEANYWKNYGR